MGLAACKKTRFMYVLHIVTSNFGVFVLAMKAYYLNTNLITYNYYRHNRLHI